jgi:hypothetical protein
VRHANLDESEFAKKAAKYFEEHPEIYSYGDMVISGCLMVKGSTPEMCSSQKTTHLIPKSVRNTQESNNGKKRLYRRK